MKVKTAELIGPALDWAVAKCEGFTDYDSITEKMLPPRREYGWVQPWDYNFSRDWSQGGPIIEWERIELHVPPWLNAKLWAWSAGKKDHNNATVATGNGPTPLIAAMRCYVASKLGDEVEIPDELCRPFAGTA